MFDILVFVYEHCRQADLAEDPERVAKRLSAAGFGEADISAALSWLAGLSRVPLRSPVSRELVLERALATSDDRLSLEQIKLIVLMVLWNQHAPASRLVAEELRSAHGSRLPH
jgi:Smg protein